MKTLSADRVHSWNKNSVWCPVSILPAAYRVVLRAHTGVSTLVDDMMFSIRGHDLKRFPYSWKDFVFAFILVINLESEFLVAVFYLISWNLLNFGAEDESFAALAVSSASGYHWKILIRHVWGLFRTPRVVVWRSSKESSWWLRWDVLSTKLTRELWNWPLIHSFHASPKPCNKERFITL